METLWSHLSSSSTYTNSMIDKTLFLTISSSFKSRQNVTLPITLNKDLFGASGHSNFAQIYGKRLQSLQEAGWLEADWSPNDKAEEYYYWVETEFTGITTSPLAPLYWQYTFYLDFISIKNLHIIPPVVLQKEKSVLTLQKNPCFLCASKDKFSFKIQFLNACWKKTSKSSQGSFFGMWYMFSELIF